MDEIWLGAAGTAKVHLLFDILAVQRFPVTIPCTDSQTAAGLLRLAARSQERRSER